jgi:hypothetical protein
MWSSVSSTELGMCHEQLGYKFLVFHTDAVKDLVLQGCGATSLGDWRPTFQDNMVISSLRIQEGFIVNVSTLEDESTIGHPSPQGCITTCQ